MTTSPSQIGLYIKLNGGAPQTGIVTAAYTDSVVLSIGSGGTGAKRAKYRIRAYPPGFTCPAGWTTEGKFFVITMQSGADATAFTLPTVLSALWGKFIFDVTRDGQLYNGSVVGEYYAKTGLKIPSASGVETAAYLEEEEFDATFGWMRAVDSLARRYEEGMPGSGDVNGPVSSTSGNLAAYNGISGLSLLDSGKPAASVVLGPASAGNLRLAAYDGTTGKLLKDVGLTLADAGQSFNVLLHGASTAGSRAANTTAFLAAITAAKAVKGTVVVPEGTFALNALSITGGGSWNLEIRTGATIDFLAATVPSASFCITIGQDSDFVELSTIGANVDKYDKTTTFTSAPDLAAEDLYIVCDDDDFSWDDGDPTRPYYKKGDFFRVREVAGVLVTNDSLSFDTYLTTDNIRCLKLLTNTVRIFGGGTILVPDNAGVTSGGIGIWNGYKCRVDDLVANGAKWAHVAFYRCYESEIRRLYVCNYTNIDVERNYGVIMLSCYACHVRNSWIRTPRHCVTITGGAVEGTHPNRLCSVSGGTYRSDLIALDMHGACEWCSFDGVWVDGGANVAGDHWAVRNSTILDCPHPTDFTGVALRVREDKGVNGIIEDVTLVARAVATGDNSLLCLLFGAPERGGTLSIKGLRFVTAGLAISQVAQIDIGGAAGEEISVDIDNATCVSELATAPQFTVSCAAPAWYDRVSFKNTKCLSPRVATVAARLVILGPGIETVDSEAAGALVELRAWPGGGVQQRVEVKGVTTIGASTPGISIAGPGLSEDIYATVSDCTAVNNGTGGGSSTTRCSVAAVGIKSISIIGNTLGDTQASQTQAFQCVITGCGTARIWDNNQEGVRLVDSIGTTTTLLTAEDMVAHVPSEDVASTAQTAALDIPVLANTTVKYIVDIEAEKAGDTRASLLARVRVTRSGTGTPVTAGAVTILAEGSGLAIAATISGTSLRLRTTNTMGADAHITTQVREESRIFTVEDS